MDNQVEKYNLLLVLDEKQINERVRQLGEQINKLYGEEALVVICVLKGAFIFFSDLIRTIKNPGLEVDFVRLSSYGMKSESSKKIIFNKDTEIDLHGKHILIVEDIVDSGHTMKFLLEEFGKRGPKTIRVAALIDKYERRETDVRVDFTGFKFSRGFLVGYGLDFAEKFRALPSIYEIG